MSGRFHMSDDRLREADREPERFDTLTLYDRLRPISGMQFVTDAGLSAATKAFAKGVREVAKQASTLHGWRAENLFRGVVVSLDAVQLIKEEDCGRYFFKGPKVKQPDFRVVTGDGSNLLIEVKNRRPTKPTGDFTMAKGEFDSLRRYCEMVGNAELKLAVYWVWWNLWTLTDGRWLIDEGNRVRLPMLEAMKRNEMARLGDEILATETPLAMRFCSDPTQPRTIAADGSFPFTIGRVELLVAGRVIERPDEKRIAYTLLMFGGWQDDRSSLEEENDEAMSITFELRPEELVPDQEFQMHNPLSSLFSSYFGASTLADDGQVRSLDSAYEPGGFGSLVEEPYEGEILRLWRFTQQPNLDLEK